MLKLFNELLEEGISPSGVYLLLCVNEMTEPSINNTEEEFKILQSKGYLHQKTITEKGLKIVEAVKRKCPMVESSGKVKRISGLTNEDLDQIVKFRDLFPKGLLPSGQPSRVPIKELEKKFKWFFDNYDYSWETILEATRSYVNKYKDENYAFMKTSGYFISKLEKSTMVSTLASYCDMVIDGALVEKIQYSSQQVI